MKTHVIPVLTLILAAGSLTAAPNPALTRNLEARVLRPALTPGFPQSAPVPAPDTLVQELVQIVYGGDTLDDVRTRYEYDGNTRLVRTVDETFNDLMQWDKDSLIAFGYDTQGRVGEETVFKWFGTDWTLFSRQVHTYDGATTRVKETVLQDYISDQWSNSYRTQRTYDANGNETQVLEQGWVSGAWKDVYRTLTTTNPIARTLTDTKQFREDSGWRNFERSVFTYGAQYLSNIVDQAWEADAWANKEKWIYNVSPQGRLNDVLRQEWSDSAWANFAFYALNYQGQRRTSMLIRGWEEEQWKDYFLISYIFAVPVSLARGLRAPSAPAIRLDNRAGVLRLRPGQSPELFDLRGKSLPLRLPAR